jgi:hypothetical protein
MNARLARTHGGSALLASGERALPHCALPGLIKNQIFKFRENLPGVSRKSESDSVCTKPAPAGNPDSVRVRGAKKSKVLLLGTKVQKPQRIIQRVLQDIPDDQLRGVS